jgi:ATP-dependent DNA helicase DinG
MLQDEVKQTVQSAYRQLLDAYAFTPRQGQRQMIAEIANCLAQNLEETDAAPPICVIEAGTGTGKTLAYILAVLPLARALKRKVVLSTATVALQEQVINKDLPDILAGSALQFSFAMAKGRGRYLCLARLDSVLRSSDSLGAMLDLYGEELEETDESTRRLYQHMLEQISAGKWHGDRDDWQEPVSDTAWRSVTVDNTQCMGARCSHFNKCFFYKARETIAKVDCVVTNHDLLLSDLALGGGVILSKPEDTIYILDEAHHLPFKSNVHFSSFTRLKGSMSWIQQCEKTINRLLAESGFTNKLSVVDRHDELVELMRETLDTLNEAWLLMEQISKASDTVGGYGNSTQIPFRLGIVPTEVKLLASRLEGFYDRLCYSLQDSIEELKQVIDEAVDLATRDLADQWYPVLGALLGRAEGSLKLWYNYAREDAEDAAPFARWLTVTEFGDGSDMSLSASPVLAAKNLRESLWERCAGAVLTSATLSALGNFDVLCMRSGLPEQTRYLSIPSPFDFKNNARFIVPRLNCAPSETEKHTNLIVKALPEILTLDSAALMLFSSRKQLGDVLQALPACWQERILNQDDYQKTQLLKYHRQRVDRGEGSIIFGLASFAEGVDLPGKYCTHVLIAKIPFAVPNDPVEMTLSDWIEQQGKNPFMTLAVPDAAFKLVQACGRLLRNETDSGCITLFDERIVNKFYGQSILNSLPPYSREIFQQQYEI